MFKVSPCFPKKTKDQYASTDPLMSMTMSLFGPKKSLNNFYNRSFKTKNVEPLKHDIESQIVQRMQRKSAYQTKNCLNGGFLKDNFHKISDQFDSKKSKTDFRISTKKRSLDFAIFDQRKKLRLQRNEKSPEVLRSSNLSEIYSRLYESYESVPFEETEKEEHTSKELDTHAYVDETLKVDEKENKITKQFEIKELSWENNLRKEIKSLTKDTDHILSMEFRDIRDVARR